jgi:flagellar biosynthesis chaperone FliJ
MLPEVIDFVSAYAWLWVDVGGIGVTGVSLYHIWTSAGHAVGRTPGNKSAKEYAKDRPGQLVMGYAISAFWPIVLGVLACMLVGTAGIALIQAPHKVLKNREHNRFGSTPAGLTEMLYEQLATLQEQRAEYGDDPAFAGSAYLADQFIGDVEQQIEELKPSVIRQQKANEIPMWAWEQQQKRVEETARRKKIRDQPINKDYPEGDAGPKVSTTPWAKSLAQSTEENQGSETGTPRKGTQTEQSHDGTSEAPKSSLSSALFEAARCILPVPHVETNNLKWSPKLYNHGDQWAKAKPRFLYSRNVRKGDGQSYTETVRETPDQELTRVHEEFDKYYHPSWMLSDYYQKIEHTQVSTELIAELYHTREV